MNYRLDYRKGNWIVERRAVHSERSSTPGRVEWKPEGFYGKSLEGAVTALLEYCIQDNYPYATDDLEAIQNAVEKAQSQVLAEIRSLEEEHIPT